ncbi:TPA: helix-turn-helix domain-containing protein [Legionella pneumophila]|jgi:predicted XRE-type DNA-binding protein
MSDLQHFDSVWDALESDPVKAENMKLRSALMIAINDHIEVMGLTQAQAAKRLHITQPRVSALTKGKIEEFRLDTLINMVHRLGLHVTMQIAA